MLRFQAKAEAPETEEYVPPALHSEAAYREAVEAEIDALYQKRIEAELAEEALKKVVEQASILPDGFEWVHWGDGSGGLYKDGKRYASYDIHSGYIEFKTLDLGWSSFEFGAHLDEAENRIESIVKRELIRRGELEAEEVEEQKDYDLDEEMEL